MARAIVDGMTTRYEVIGSGPPLWDVPVAEARSGR
jgi:hypothetical protein